MDETEGAVKNTAYLACAELITKIISFMIVIIVARYLQEINFGKYSFAFAYTSFFAIISDLGLDTLAIRDIARNKESAGKLFVNTSLIKFVLSIISFVLLVVIINLMNYPQDTILAVYILGIYALINSFNQLFRSVFRAFEKMRYEAIVRIIEKVITLFLIIYLISNEYGLIEIVSVFLIASVLTFILSGYFTISRFIKIKFELDTILMKKIFKEALPFGFTAIFIVIYFRIDTVMLSLMVGDKAVGLYNASYNIIDGLTGLVAGSLGGMALPVMSRYFVSVENRKYLKITYIQLFELSLIAGLLISIFVTIFAEDIIQLFYGSEYLDAAASLKILIWAFFIICISTISSTLLNSIGKQKIVTFGTGMGALLNIILNMLLIPHFSYLGAALATVITEIVGLSIYLYYSTKLLDINWRNITLFQSAMKENWDILRKSCSYSGYKK